MRHVIYLRTSTEEQTPENQLKDVQSLAPVDAEILIEKASAWKNEERRPVFSVLRKDVLRGAVASICIWDLDRLYRNRKASVEFLRLCYAQGVAVRSYRQEWLSQIEKLPSPWNEIVREFLIQILSWLAEEESDKRSKRVKIAHQNHSGNSWGRPKAEFNSYRAYQLLFVDGLSIRAVAKELGVSKDTISRRKKQWEKTPPSFINERGGA